MKRSFVLVIHLLLSGCVGLNNVSEIQPGETWAPSPDQAVLFFGVGLEVEWPHKGFGLQLDEYDAEAGINRGNCLIYNRAYAILKPPTPGTVKYFAYSVEPGYYAPGGLAFYPLEKTYQKQAFRADAGVITYIGDFIYRGNREPMLLRRDLRAARAALRDFPALKGDPVVAETIPIKGWRLFLCTP